MDRPREPPEGTIAQCIGANQSKFTFDANTYEDSYKCTLDPLPKFSTLQLAPSGTAFRRQAVPGLHSCAMPPPRPPRPPRPRPPPPPPPPPPPARDRNHRATLTEWRHSACSAMSVTRVQPSRWTVASAGAWASARTPTSVMRLQCRMRRVTSAGAAASARTPSSVTRVQPLRSTLTRELEAASARALVCHKATPAQANRH
jgi:hypothetical protein